MDESALGALQFFATTLSLIAFAAAIGSLLAIGTLRHAGSSWAMQGRAAGLRMLRAACVATLAASALSLWAQTALIAELPLLEAAGSIRRVLFETHFGRTWAAGAMAMVGASGVAALAASGHGPRRGLLALVALGLSIAALMRSWSGHAGVTDEALPILVDWTHLLSTSAWAGSVGVASATVLRRPVSVNQAERAECARYLAQLSSIATAALLVLAASGIAGAARQLDGDAGALLTTGYGAVLLWKVGLAGAAALLGAYNRFAALPRLRAALGAARMPFRQALARVRRVLRIEALALLVVLALASALTLSQPVAHRDDGIGHTSPR